MWIVRAAVLVAFLVGLSACSSKIKTYDGPEVTRIVVFKDERRMYLFHNDQVLKSYEVGLGFAPEGHKAVEGDGRTPEGRYRIDRRNPNSSFHLSVGISYPNTADVARAASFGQSPGGDIFIHGTPNLAAARGPDWTAGCIAVSNEEIEEIYAMVPLGIPIDIYK
ncbi:L,D-transpeptidase family protein [Poseidonocella sedimentorum]|uniref:L,D-transpeptidase catalytic domain n=1 Tax=Poseidonocella sedimentorum TaxID=871652 RepID=A0A1I6D4Q2_9RHOB|nr:L,D-transpeptidase family protein [Poseidonocella sedimentorum]SFR00353.1 L,D-transpeptidase catalytic domain [Poseidonocella sedimentorum]